MSLNFNETSYVLPVATTTTLGGVKIDGETITIEDGVISAETTPITIDDTLSSSSTNPVQNKVLYPSLSSFIPAETSLTVELDGTGDFTTLEDALSYLVGKWSNGRVFVRLGEGTFNVSSTCSIDGQLFCIPSIVITGVSSSSTILSSSITGSASMLEIICNQLVYVNNLTFRHPSGTISTNYRGITVNRGAFMSVNGCTFEGVTRAVCAIRNARIEIGNNVTFNNLNIAIYSGTSTITTTYNQPINFNNVTTAWHVVDGGQIHGYGPNCTYTNVTNKTSQTVGTATNNGWITGITV